MDLRHEIDDVLAVRIWIHRAEGLPEFERGLRLGLVDDLLFDPQT